MRYAGLFFALGLLVATAAPAYADCPAHEQTASASQARLKQPRAEPLLCGPNSPHSYQVCLAKLNPPGVLAPGFFVPAEPRSDRHR